MDDSNFKAGDKIVTVARDGARMARCTPQIARPIWTAAEYTAAVRKRDGVLTWRRTGAYGRTASGDAPSGRLIAEAREIADELRLAFVEGVRHGQRVG